MRPPARWYGIAVHLGLLGLQSCGATRAIDTNDTSLQPWSLNTTQARSGHVIESIEKIGDVLPSASASSEQNSKSGSMSGLERVEDAIVNTQAALAFKHGAIALMELTRVCFIFSCT